MLWQDIVISIANLLSIFSITNQVISGFKEKTGPIKFLTSAPIFTGLFAMSIAYWTLRLYFSSVTTFLNAILWFILFIQRLIYKK